MEEGWRETNIREWRLRECRRTAVARQFYLDKKLEMRDEEKKTFNMKDMKMNDDDKWGGLRGHLN